MLESPPFWMYIIGFLLVLGPLITVHELGHYLVGRWLGVGADVFSVGMGNEIIGRTDKRGTRWRLSAIPLGGYVQFKGDMNPASIPDPDAPADNPADKGNGSFQHASLWKRSLIVLAGPVTNLIVAIGIFAAFFAIFGRPVAQDPEEATKIARFSEVSAAREAGMQVGDKIVALDGEPLADFQDLAQRVIINPGRAFEVDFERNGEAKRLQVTAADATEKDRFGNPQRVGRFGIYPPEQTVEKVGFLDSIIFATDSCWSITKMMVTGIKQVIVGDRSIKELGGPLKIAKYSGEQFSLGWLPLISFAALISLNLAFINLLPIPALDGGHLAFYAAEAVRRKPVSPRTMEYAYMGGMAFVLTFMVVVTFNDLVSLPLFGS